MNMKRNNSLIIWGVILLLAGVVLILAEAHIISSVESLILPVILLGLSLAFHMQYFMNSGRNEGLLVPGGILLAYGLMALAVLQFGISFEKLAPVLILGPALGLFEMYVFSGGRSGSMVPVFVLTVIGGCGLLLTCGIIYDFGMLVALLLIGIGLTMIINVFVKGYGRGAHPASGQNADAEKKAEAAQDSQPK
jgi:hypothetical protein